VKDFPSAAQSQAPASQVPVEGAEAVPVPTGATAEVAGVAGDADVAGIAGAADDATGLSVAAGLDAPADTVAKTPGALCVY